MFVIGSWFREFGGGRLRVSSRKSGLAEKMAEPSRQTSPLCCEFRQHSYRSAAPFNAANGRVRCRQDRGNESSHKNRPRRALRKHKRAACPLMRHTGGWKTPITQSLRPCLRQES